MSAKGSREPSRGGRDGVDDQDPQNQAADTYRPLPLEHHAEKCSEHQAVGDAIHE
jgi:hypothetical protein